MRCWYNVGLMYLTFVYPLLDIGTDSLCYRDNQFEEHDSYNLNNQQCCFLKIK